MQWIKSLGIPILAAIITSLATIFGPPLADRYLNRPILAYDVLQSATISSAGDEVRIYSYKVENAGSKPLTDMRGSITAPIGGKIGQFASDAGSLNLQTSTTEDGRSLNIYSPSLLAGEKFTITALLHGNSQPAFRLRTAEAIGDTKNKLNDSQTLALQIAGGVAAALLYMLILWLSILARGGRSKTVMKGNYSRSESIIYIAERFEIDSWKSILATKESELTYRIFADVVRHRYSRKEISAHQAVVVILLLGFATNNKRTRSLSQELVLNFLNLPDDKKKWLETYIPEREKRAHDLKIVVEEVDAELNAAGI